MATTSVLRFSDSFWDEDDRGIGILTDKLTQSEQTCHDLKKLYETRAQIEKDYGERLLELSQHTLGDIELGTLATAMQRIPFAFETTARAHIDLAEQLDSTLEVPLTNFLKEQSELINARSHQIENSKHLKDIHQAHVDKAKREYDDIQQQLQEKQANGEDTETLRNSLALADREWQHSAEILQEVTDKFTLDWKITCDLYQDLEERRINFIRSNIWAFANMMSSVYIVDDRGCEGIRTGLEATDVRQDINDFIFKYGTSVKLTDNQHQHHQQQDQQYPSPATSIHQTRQSDPMSSAFEEVENMLSDTNGKRHSLDQHSIHSNQSRHSISSLGSNTSVPKSSNHQHQHQHQRQTSVTTIEPKPATTASPASFSPNQHASSAITSPATLHGTTQLSPKEHQHQLQHHHQHQQPSMPTLASVQQLSVSHNSNNNNTNHIGAVDDDDVDDNESRQPVRVPKPREEKWTISARRNGPSSAATSRPQQRPSNNNNGSNGTHNHTMTHAVPSSQAPMTKNRTAYLAPMVHPPQPFYINTSSAPSSSSSLSTMAGNTLYPPESSANINNSNNTKPFLYSSNSNNNSHSSLYQLTSGAGSSNSLNVDGSQKQPPAAVSASIPPSSSNYNHPSNHAGTYQSPPGSNNSNKSNKSNMAATYQPSITSAYQPPAATVYQPPVMNNSTAYRPPSGSTNVNGSTTTAATTTTYQASASAAYAPLPSTYQPSSGTAASTYHPVARPYQPSKPTNTTQLASSAATTSTITAAPSFATEAPTNGNVTVTPFQPQKNTAYQPSHTKSVPQQQERPPQKNESSSTSPPPSSTSVLSKPTNSAGMVGIRPPGWQDHRQGELENKAASEYLQGEGAPTSPARSGLQRYSSVNGPRAPPVKDNYIASSDLKNTPGISQESASILAEEQEGKKKESEEQEKEKEKEKENDTKETTQEQQQETPKSGFSFNNIFFKKDKPSDDDGSKLPDGTVYKHKARAMWNYEAKIDSELSFQANDCLAIIRKQPDGWWEAEILDEKRRQRGLVPGNYMSLQN